MLTIPLAILSAFCNACAAVLQREANVAAPEGQRHGWRVVCYLVRQPKWLLGIGFMVGTLVFSVAALYFGSLAVVQPVLVTELVFVLVLRRWWLHDPIASNLWMAAGAVCLGLTSFLVIADPREGHGSPTASAWAIALSTRTVIVLVLFVLSRSGSASKRAALLGCAAGLVWSVDAAFVKQATEVASASGWLSVLGCWSFYAAIATGILGTLLLQAAVHAGPLAASQTAILLTDPLTSIMLGIELFGETVRNSPAAIAGQVIALAIMAGGVVLSARWAPSSPEVALRSLR
jgi:hypothetical protein